MNLPPYWLDTSQLFNHGSSNPLEGCHDVAVVDLNPWKDFDWPAIPGYFGRPWFLPILGAYYRMKDIVR
jgi:hypothetical protein